MKHHIVTVTDYTGKMILHRYILWVRGCISEESFCHCSGSDCWSGSESHRCSYCCFWIFMNLFICSDSEQEHEFVHFFGLRTSDLPNMSENEQIWENAYGKTKIAAFISFRVWTTVRGMHKSCPIFGHCLFWFQQRKSNWFSKFVPKRKLKARLNSTNSTGKVYKRPDDEKCWVNDLHSNAILIKTNPQPKKYPLYFTRRQEFRN